MHGSPLSHRGLPFAKEILMADIVDIAQNEENSDRDAAILAALAPPAGCESGPCWIDGLAYCRECETPIPEKRLKAVPGTGLCVFCAAEIQEKKAAARHIAGRDTRYILPVFNPAFVQPHELT